MNKDYLFDDVKLLKGGPKWQHRKILNSILPSDTPVYSYIRILFF